jgi:hypothetical protein
MEIVPLRHFFPLKVVPLIEVSLYIDKVVKKKKQHAESSKMLAADVYDVMLLPGVLGSAG